MDLGLAATYPFSRSDNIYAPEKAQRSKEDDIMRFQFNFASNQIDNNGNVNAGIAKKVVEDCAEKAYSTGKVEGWVLGGLFVAGVYIALDAACSFFDDEKK